MPNNELRQERVMELILTYTSSASKTFKSSLCNLRLKGAFLCLRTIHGTVTTDSSFKCASCVYGESSIKLPQGFIYFKRSLSGGGRAQ